MSAFLKGCILLLGACGVLLLSAPLDAPVLAQAKHDCNWCHDLHGTGPGGMPLINFGTDQELCLSCHQDGAPLTWQGITIPKGVAVHSGSKYGAFEASCVDCHDHNGETSNLKLIGSVVDHWGKFAGGADKPVVYSATTGAGSLSDGAGPPYDSLCQVCHTQTSDGTGTLARHRQDGTSDAHNQGLDCKLCHTHSAKFAPGGGGCTGCHNQPQPPAAPTRRDVVSEFSYTSHHINWVAAGYASPADIPDSDCEVCHNQATHQDGIVDLNDVDTGAAGVYVSTVASDVATFCGKCHDADAANGSAPFSDGMTPPVIDAAAWSSSTDHGTIMTTGACLECHSSGHGVQKETALFPVCDNCHIGGTAKYAQRHYDPHDTGVPTISLLRYEIDCLVCHTPHTHLPNKFYVDGVVTHNHYTGTGTLESSTSVGLNIQLYGRDEDGAGITKIAVPMQIISVASPGGCTDPADIEANIYMPPWQPDGQGPIYSIMVGDMIEVSNSSAAFNGNYRVTETNWDNTAVAYPTGRICFNPEGATAPNPFQGWVRSVGWLQKPIIQDAVWASTGGGEITFHFSGPTSIRRGIHQIKAGDIVNVMNVTPSAYNGQYKVKTGGSAEASITVYSTSDTAVPDPGVAYTSGGTVEYVGSVKGIADITIQGPPATPIYNVVSATCAKVQGTNTVTMNLNAAPGYAPGTNVTVAGVTPTGYNGTVSILTSSATTITYVPGGNCPTAAGPGGTVQEVPSGSYSLLVELDANSNNAAILNMTAATSSSAQNGDIVRIYGASPSEYNERWEVIAVNPGASPPTITLECPPYLRAALSLPACNIASMGTYSAGSGTLQSTGTMREVVFDSRGTDHTDGEHLGDYGHSFTNTDLPTLTQDGYMYGPCETCHTASAIANHKSFDYGNTHNNGRTCSLGCHWHSIGFDKGSDACTRPTCISN